jgi:PAP2 superfamily
MKFALVALWPVGLAVIFAVALIWSRQTGPDVARSTTGALGGSHSGYQGRLGWPSGSWLIDAAKIIGLVFIGAAVVYGVMGLLGLLVVNHGGVIDHPIYTWTTHHRVHPWVRVLDRLTKIGDTWTCWAAAVAAAVCLSVTWRTRRWLPPIVLAACMVVDHYTTLALRHTFHRLGPPDSPSGTYPSGGCDRSVLFFGLIAYLLWREFSGGRKAAIWAGATVAALGFNEAYSRVYLTLHWFTDALSGLLYGALLLAVFIVAIRFLAGPAVSRPGQGSGRRRAAGESARTSEAIA